MPLDDQDDHIALVQHPTCGIICSSQSGPQLLLYFQTLIEAPTIKVIDYVLLRGHCCGMAQCKSDGSLIECQVVPYSGLLFISKHIVKFPGSNLRGVNIYTVKPGN